MNKQLKQKTKKAAIRGSVEAAPGFISALFGFFRRLFRGDSAKEAAKELAENATDAAETITTVVVDEVMEEVGEPKN